MRLLLFVMIIFVFCFSNLSVEAQSSSGGGDWFTGWPTQLPIPGDIPQEGVVPGSTLTLSGELNSAWTPFKAVFEVPNQAKLVYEYYDSYISDGTNTRHHSLSERSYTRTAYSWQSTEYVVQSYGGWACSRELENDIWVPFGSSIFTSDKVFARSISFTLSDNGGVISATRVFNKTQSASIDTTSGTTIKKKLISSKTDLFPDWITPTTPEVNSSLSIALNEDLGSGWSLKRIRSDRLNQGITNENTIYEENTYPVSVPGNTGTVNIAAFPVVDNYSHIIALANLNPSVPVRQIYFYRDFTTTIPWTMFPFS